MSRDRLTAALLLVALVLVPRVASAQPTLDIRVDVGVQANTPAASDTFELPLYTERERITAAYPGAGGACFSAAARYRVWKQLTIGAGVSTFAHSGETIVTAAMPHPFFDNQFRSVDGTALTRREEVTTHIAAGWLVPLTDRIVLGLSAGPAFVHVHQAFVTGVSVDEVYPYDTASFKSAAVSDASRTAPGVYAGADAAWMLTAHLGVGGIIQFTHARVKERVGDRTIGIEAGGLQGGGGIRIRV